MTTTLPRPVEVLHDGHWCPGWLEAYRHDEDGWRAFVRYRLPPDSTYLHWRPANEVRSEPSSEPGLVH